MDNTVAVSRSNDKINSQSTYKPRHHFPPRAQDNHLGWHARLRERIPDARARDVLATLAGLSDENGRVTLHAATLANLCGISVSTFQRRCRKLCALGELRIIPRRLARDYNGPNTYIVNNHAGFRGGAGQNCQGRALKANTENIELPAGPSLKPCPAKPHTRHIVASSQIARQFCDERRIGPYLRLRLTQRIQDRLNAGEEEAAIVADLDREHRARLEAVKPHRGTHRSSQRRREAEERMARDNYTCTYHPPVTPAEVEAEEKRLAAINRQYLIALVTGSARVREDMLRCGQCTQAEIDEGLRLAGSL